MHMLYFVFLLYIVTKKKQSVNSRSQTLAVAHTFVIEQRGLPLIHSKFLAAKYESELRMNPAWPFSSFHKRVLKDIQIDFKPHVLRRAKRKAMKVIKGIDAKQYAKLWDYRTELLAKNPNSTIELLFELGKRLSPISNCVYYEFKLYICN